MPELHVYDFDGTLFRSPDPPDKWPDKGAWWSDSISLSDPCVPTKPGSRWWNTAVVSAARQSIADPEVFAILCTGRAERSFARYRVPELLRQAGLDFDRVHLKTTENTEAFKKQVILFYLTRYPDITAVHIYEDRLNHLAAFCRMVTALGVECVPHPIQTPNAVCEDAIQRVARRWTALRRT